MDSRGVSLLLLPLLCCISAERPFRSDYEYFPEIEGWLKMNLIPATWHDARLRCALEGAVLASPINRKMMTAMDTLWRGNSSTQCVYYTGVHATFSKGDFFSVEGVPLAKLPLRWAAGEPDNAKNNEDCIVLINGTLADANCYDPYPYMCFRKKTKDMIMTSCGTIDKEYELSPVTNNCYKFHLQGKIWSRAFMTCAAEGGYLAIINSNDEALALKAIYDKNYARILPGILREIISIGVHDWGEHGVWRTIHGETIEEAGFADWQGGQPDNITSPTAPGQFCGGLLRSAKLADNWCDKPAPFICEKAQDSLLDDNILE